MDRETYRRLQVINIQLSTDSRGRRRGGDPQEDPVSLSKRAV